MSKNIKTNVTANNDTNDGAIRIRAVCAADAAVLGDLHYRAYADRFFDPAARDRAGRLYGAPLAAERPELARGQDAVYFRDYWRDFVTKLDGPDPLRRNYAFVAERDGRICAFIKGDGAPVAADAPMRDALRTVFADAARCGELGSVYCDPAVKYSGMGRALSARFAACIRGLGYEGMVTRAYAKNDSPAFFEKLGARMMGDCAIPNDYRNAAGRIKTVAIPGVWLYWDKAALGRLAGPG